MKHLPGSELEKEEALELSLKFANILIIRAVGCL